MKQYVCIALVILSLSFTAKGQNDMCLQNDFQETQSEVEVFHKQTIVEYNNKQGFIALQTMKPYYTEHKANGYSA